jgi:long-chain acyl-CoA synthetase
MPRANLISLFAEFARYARDVAVVQRRGYRREAWTYAKLADVAFACEQELKERGVRTGDRVLVWGTNSAEWMAAFWGCLLRGAVAVPMDDGATMEFAARVARETSAKLIIAARDKPLLDAAVPALKLEDLADIARRPRVVVTQHIHGESPRPIYESLADEPLTRRHIAQILFTSGTTAEPRGVVLTHGNFLANLEPLARGIDPYRKYERWFHPLRFVTLVPLSHVFGQFMALFVPPLLGAAVVFENSANPAEIVRTIKRERATALIAVPRMLDGLRAGMVRDLETRGRSEWFRRAFAAANGKKFLSRAWKFRRIHRRFGWKFWAFISGGAALSGETEDFLKRMGYAVVQGYGMTETASLISLNHPFRAAQGSIGKVLPGREFQLAEDGEILVRGENVAAGYWEAGALRPSEERGWLRTGDVGEIDAKGNLRFRGRKKNVIVTPAGLNVYPEDLEVALRKQSGVRDCVVVPVEHGGNAEPCAVLLMEDVSCSRPLQRAGFSATSSPSAAEREAPRSEDRGYRSDASDAAARQAVEGANDSLAEYQRMRSWCIWPEADFPRTSTGKPRLAAVAAAAMQILGGAKREGGASSGSLESLIGRFAAPGNRSSRLENELSLSSLDRVELMSALEERYQVELSETAFAEAKTVGDVERLLREPSSRRSDYVYPRWTQRAAVRWLRLAAYYALVWPATQILGHPKIVGRENLQGMRGPVLVVSNHITRRADIGLVLAALPRRFRHHLSTAMGGETLQNMRRPPRDWFFAKRWAYQVGYWLVTALFNVFPLPQFSGFRESFRYAGESVDRGYSVLVFPEGEVNDSATGEMANFQSGIGLLAENLNVPIVPMRLDGVWKMKRERRRLAHLGEITVRIGTPITFPPGTAPDQIAGTLESAVRSL